MSTTLDDYTDVRTGIDTYQQIPCMECGESIWVPWDFPEDEWYCDGCKPEELREIDTRPRVEVRL